MGYKVMAEKCATCIFSAHTPISPARFQELRATWAENDVAQECHTATIAGLEYGCKGHYEAARSGAIPHPITGACEQAFGITGLEVSDLMQIAERLGLVEFITIE